MVHTKKLVESVEKARLISTVLFLLAFLKVNHPRLYRKAEHMLGLNPHHLKGRATKTHFRSMKAYRKFTAYLHIHDVPHHKAKYVYIAGRRKKVSCPRCK